jgi:hypothetical protein
VDLEPGWRERERRRERLNDLMVSSGIFQKRVYWDIIKLKVKKSNVQSRMGENRQLVTDEPVEFEK